MTSEQDAPALVLYHTAGCHLCELAEAIARPLAVAAGVRLRLADIAGSDALMERYGARIPVLADPAVSGAEIGWPFAAADVAEMLGAVSRRACLRAPPASR